MQYRLHTLEGKSAYKARDHRIRVIVQDTEFCCSQDTEFCCSQDTEFCCSQDNEFCGFDGYEISEAVGGGGGRLCSF